MPIAPYSGMYDATVFGDLCPQDSSGANNQSSLDMYLAPFESIWFDTFTTPTDNVSEDCEFNAGQCVHESSHMR